MTNGTISNKLKELKFKKIDLIKYLPISRSTLYVYMELYENNNLDEIPDENIIKLFDLILKNNTTKNDIIKFMLDNFDEKSVKENQKNSFSDKDYGVEENVTLLEKNLQILRNAAKWSIEKLSDDSGVSIEKIAKVEAGTAKLEKPEAIALFTSLCRESREKEEDDILPITFSVIFDEHNLLPKEKEIGMNYIRVVTLANTLSNTNIDKKEFKENFQKYTGKKFTVGAAIGASAVIISGLVLSFIKHIK